MGIVTNLEILKPSRKPPAVGDVFSLRPKGHPFLFGRVINDDVRVGGFAGILVYIYRATSADEKHIPTLRPSELLIPPLATNRQPWTRGYFHTLTHAPLTKWDLLVVHCFRDALTDSCFDEFGRKLPKPVDPVGTFGLDSYRSIDDAISDALSIARVPD